MDGDKGKAAPKLGWETEVLHAAGYDCFGVFSGHSESEQIPTTELKLKGKWRVLYPSSEGKPNARADGKPGLRHFTLLLNAGDTISHGQAEWREGVHVSGPLGHETPALLQGVGGKI